MNVGRSLWQLVDRWAAWPTSKARARSDGTWQLVPLVSGRDHIQRTTVLPTTHQEVYVTFSQEGLTRLKLG
jgi:hypothetical protein